MPLSAKIGVFISLNVLLSILLIEFDAFEAFFEFSRAHEDWELDEFVVVAIVGLVVGALWIALECVGLAKDLRQTHRKQLETERDIANLRRIQVMNALSAGIAHSGNNLMQPIVSLSRVSRQQLAPGHEVIGHLERIEAAANSAAELFANVLRLSKAEQASKHVDVTELIEKNELLLHVLVPPSAKLSVSLPGRPVIVAISGANLMDILIVLLTNAADAVENEAGEIGIRVGDPDEVPGFAVIEMTDNGCGIAEEDIDRIFDPFFTRKRTARGTGLGLSIARTLMEDVGGRIEVRSVIGEGSTFRVLLPVAEDVEVAAG